MRIKEQTFSHINLIFHEGNMENSNIVTCPICNKNNKVSKTFVCCNCKTENLCLSHLYPKNKYVTAAIQQCKVK